MVKKKASASDVRDQNPLKVYDDNLWRYKRLRDEPLFALQAGLEFKVQPYEQGEGAPKRFRQNSPKNIRCS